MRVNKMTASLVEKTSQDFWKEVKKCRKTKSGVSSCADGANGPQEVCNVFMKKILRFV